MLKEAIGKQIQSIASFIFCLLVLFSVLGIRGVGAVSSSSESLFCGNNEASTYNAYITLRTGQYDIYGRMGKRGQSVLSDVYSKSEEKNCKLIGSTVLGADSWKKLGDLDIVGSTEQTISLFLSSSALDDSTDANRPTLMVVPRINPVCIPTTECNITIDGSLGYIRAAGTLLNEESLHVLQVVDPKTDTIEKVDYFVGNRLAYTKPTLEAFDLRYVPGGRQSVSRVIRYKSRQKVVLPQTVEQSTFNGFKNYLFTLWTGNKIGILFLLAVTLTTFLLALTLRIRSYLYHKKMWKFNHDLAYQNRLSSANSTAFSNKQQFVKDDPKWVILLLRLKPYLLGFVIFIAVMIFANTFIFRLFQVDGVSMQSTLHTGQRLFINKLGKTWSGLNGKEYLPKRGEVIVFHRIQSIEFEPGGISESEKEYMVKRVLGLPGERVVLKKGVITIYNDAHPEGFNPDEGSSWSKKMHVGANDNIDVQLGQSEVFVAGDNRPESVDSRYNGPIETKEIIGNALGVVWPLNQTTKL